MELDYKQLFLRNPYINPETRRYIKIGGPTYKKLIKKYGNPDLCSNLVTTNKILYPKITPIIQSEHQLPYIPEEIKLAIILQIDDINDLANLYGTSNKYKNIINDKNTLKLLMEKFKPHQYSGFNETHTYFDYKENMTKFYCDYGYQIEKNIIPEEINNFRDFIIWYDNTRLNKRCNKYYPLNMCSELAAFVDRSLVHHFADKTPDPPVGDYLDTWKNYNDKITWNERAYYIYSSADILLRDKVDNYINKLQYNKSDKYQTLFIILINYYKYQPYSSNGYRYPLYDIDMFNFVNEIYTYLTKLGYIKGRLITNYSFEMLDKEEREREEYFRKQKESQQQN
jgi:hypothetical protein